MWSISSTLYAQIFCTNVFSAAFFSTLPKRHVYKKFERIMLMKLTSAEKLTGPILSLIRFKPSRYFKFWNGTMSVSCNMRGPVFSFTRRKFFKAFISFVSFPCNWKHGLCSYLFSVLQNINTYISTIYVWFILTQAWRIVI